MKSFALLPHTADIRFLLHGSSLEELFLAGFEALAFVLSKKKSKQKGPAYEEVIELESPDETSLLIDFLSQVLTLSHVNHMHYGECIVENFGETTIKAKVLGSPVNSFNEDIKAITYHEAQITRDEHGIFSTIVVCDI